MKREDAKTRLQVYTRLSVGATVAFAATAVIIGVLAHASTRLWGGIGVVVLSLGLAGSLGFLRNLKPDSVGSRRVLHGLGPRRGGRCASHRGGGDRTPALRRFRRRACHVIRRCPARGAAAYRRLRCALAAKKVAPGPSIPKGPTIDRARPYQTLC